MTEHYAGQCDQCGRVHKRAYPGLFTFDGDSSIYPTECGASKPNGHTCHSTLYMLHMDDEEEMNFWVEDWEEVWEKRQAEQDA